MGNDNRFEDVRRAFDAHAPRLFTLSNLMAAGVGAKVTGGQPTGQFAVKCFVPRKLPPRLVPATHMIPPKLSTPAADVLTDVEEMQPPTAPPWLVDVNEQRLTALIGNKERLRPFGGGASISSIRSPIGTVACTVMDRFGNFGVLSCNHVLAALNRGFFGDPVVQPAIDDFGRAPSDVCGFLAWWQPISFGPAGTNLVDAAIARVQPVEVTPFIELVGKVAGIRSGNALSPGTPVHKVGRTTGLTRGTVVAVHVKGWITYPPVLGGPAPAFFEDQIVTTAMAGFGDSGSLLLDESNAVGLLFAGSATHTFYNDFVHVQNSLGVLIPGLIGN